MARIAVGHDGDAGTQQAESVFSNRQAGLDLLKFDVPCLGCKTILDPPNRGATFLSHAHLLVEAAFHTVQVGKKVDG